MHNLPGQSVPVLSHLHSEKMFPDIQMELLVFQFVLIASGPVTVHHWEESGSILFVLSPQVFMCINKIYPYPKPSLLQAKQLQLSAFPHRKDAPDS